MKGEHLKKQLQQFSLGGREISLKDLTKSPPTANSENCFCRYSLVFCPRLAGETLSYSVKFGLLPAKSLPSANLHKNIGRNTRFSEPIRGSQGMADGINLVLQIQFGLPSAPSLRNANSHKNIGDKTPSPLTCLGVLRGTPLSRAGKGRWVLGRGEQ